MYSKGRGIKTDYQEGIKWYKKAAEQGYAESQLNLAVKYHLGQGIKADKNTAIKWYTKAAEQGHEEAQFNLGYLYYLSKTNEKKAEKWFLKSANQGVTRAQNFLGKLYYDETGILADKYKAYVWLEISRICGMYDSTIIATEQLRKELPQDDLLKADRFIATRSKELRKIMRDKKK